MQKLRNLYAETQNNSRNNFDKVTLERCKKIMAYVNKESETMANQNDYTHIQELGFYQEKFQSVIDKFNSAINDKTKKPKLQADIVAVLSQNFRSSTDKPMVTPQFMKEEKPVTKVQSEVNRGEVIREVRGQDPKDIINSYFDAKRVEIQKSKIGFKSVLDTLPKSSQKYGVRGTGQAKKQNDQQIIKLNGQLKQLGKKLEETKSVSEFNHGLYQEQKNQYEVRIKDLVYQIQQLNRQNEKLKQHTSPVQSQHLYYPPQTIIQQVYVPQSRTTEVYNPHVIKYRENDINKLNKKHQADQLAYSEVRPDVKVTGVVSKYDTVNRRASEQEILMKAFPNEPIVAHNPAIYDSQFERSNLRFNKSEADHEENNIAIRSKLSFFRPSVVLYRGQQFELAIKSSDLVQLQSRKIVVYVNNKDKFQRKVSLTYKCDPNYYDLRVTKKLSEVEGWKQGKEQVEVRLKNKNDLDNLIQAKLVINNKTINFLLPAMFIEFSNNKPVYIRKQNYEKNVVTPISQFSNVFSAIEMIPFEKEYQDRVETGSVYARSKYHQGLITLRWRSKREVQIQTIKPWLLFFSYLVCKDY